MLVWVIVRMQGQLFALLVVYENSLKIRSAFRGVQVEKKIVCSLCCIAVIRQL